MQVILKKTDFKDDQITDVGNEQQWLLAVRQENPIDSRLMGSMIAGRCGPSAVPMRPGVGREDASARPSVSLITQGFAASSIKDFETMLQLLPLLYRPRKAGCLPVVHTTD